MPVPRKGAGAHSLRRKLRDLNVGETHMSRQASRIASVTASIALIALVGACQKEGPAERAGKQVDKAVDKIGQQVEKAGDKIQDATKK